MDALREKAHRKEALEGTAHGLEARGLGLEWHAYALLGVAVVALLVLVFQSVQVSALRGELEDFKSELLSVKASHAAMSPQKGSVDMAGWTENEKMMYEHHGTLPARMQGAGSGAMKGESSTGCH